jgi:hypothetical protein
MVQLITWGLVYKTAASFRPEHFLHQTGVRQMVNNIVPGLLLIVPSAPTNPKSQFRYINKVAKGLNIYGMVFCRTDCICRGGPSGRYLKRYIYFFRTLFEVDEQVGEGAYMYMYSYNVLYNIMFVHNYIEYLSDRVSVYLLSLCDILGAVHPGWRHPLSAGWRPVRVARPRVTSSIFDTCFSTVINISSIIKIWLFFPCKRPHNKHPYIYITFV